VAPGQKQEAMNDTGDMARDPRIKGDAVTPKQKVGGQKRVNLTIGDIL